MIDPVSIPYLAPFDQLPSDLPTTDAIVSSADVLCEQSSRKVVAVGTLFVVQYGLQVDLEEGRTTIFIRRKTSVPVPNDLRYF